jgi:hypothetical protein
MSWLMLAAAAYVVFVVFTLALVRVGKRADEATERHARALGHSVETRPGDAALRRVARGIRDALQAERVSVVLTNPGEPTTGVVAACLGAPGLVGSRVPVEPTSATGVLGPAEAPVVGLASGAGSDAWTFAHLPLTGMSDLVGTVTAASRSRTFAEADLALMEHVARDGARPFDRRQQPRSDGGLNHRFRRPR